MNKLNGKPQLSLSGGGWVLGLASAEAFVAKHTNELNPNSWALSLYANLENQ